MKVLMLGWEFPPYITGGLGTACYGLTRAMSETGTDVLFVLPRPVASEYASHVTLVAPGSRSARRRQSQAGPLGGSERVTLRTVDAVLMPYSSVAQHQQAVEQLQVGQQGANAQRETTATPSDTAPASVSKMVPASPALDVRAGAHYSGDLFVEVERYACLVAQIAESETFDVIHAHDWMTFPAGMAVAGLTGKPLVVHVHSTEFDRSGEQVNHRIYDIERRGMERARRVIAVSYLTKRLITSRYGIPDERVSVVYNAIDQNGLPNLDQLPARIERDDKIVLFLGRITMQKGPEYFLAAAKRVLDVMDNVRFVMAGSGDMIRRAIEMAARMGIGQRVLFTGFLQGNDVARIFKMADLYVMPSVSEPFGIAPLEALSHDVPVIISKQSGVAEVLTHALKVDFWDIDEMANKIIAVLRHPPLHSTLREHGGFDLKKLSWSDSAKRCLEVYNQAVRGG
jgi:glycosyltransferase involved in cell wall biosynthesis